MMEQEKCGGSWSQLSLLGRWIGNWISRGEEGWELGPDREDERK